MFVYRPYGAVINGALIQPDTNWYNRIPGQMQPLYKVTYQLHPFYINDIIKKLCNETIMARTATNLNLLTLKLGIFVWFW